MVTRKMMSITNITSTNGVVLIVTFSSASSSSTACWTSTAMILSPASCPSSGQLAYVLYLLALADQIGLQVAGEGAQLLGDHLVAANQVVIEQHRGHRDEQTDGGHDQRFTDRAGDLVDRGLTGDTDADQRVQDTHDGSEQTDKGRNRADRTQEGDAAPQTGVGVFQLTGQGHADPVIEADQGGAAGGSLETG